jgi:UDP-N-acetylglucosamine 2-epimerase (non-hydrolysing)
MKAASIIRAIRKHNTVANIQQTSTVFLPTIDHVLVHTGQHYDTLMCASFFADLDLPAPDVLLGVGPASPVAQTAEIQKRFEEVLLRERPDVVVVVGDVNSTLACALVTAKISFDSMGTRPLLAHVEAGLRSFDRLMPEEINRLVTDHISDLLFVTEESAVQNLRREGVSDNSIHLVGNTMIDSLLMFKEKAETTSTILQRLGLRAPQGGGSDESDIGRYALLTLHRPSNVDNRETFRSILAGLQELATQCPIIFPVHPRTKRQMREFCLQPHVEMSARTIKEDADETCPPRDGIILTEPLGYLDFLCLMKHATLVVTDSGGIQEETTCLGVPCVTVRENTERPVTVESGTNIIAGTREDKIAAAIRLWVERKVGSSMPKKWDGHAATRIVEILVGAHSERTTCRELVES